MSAEEKEVVHDVDPADILGAEEEQTDLEVEESEPEQPTEIEDTEETSPSTEEPVETEDPTEAVLDEPAPELVPYKVSWGGREHEVQVPPDVAKTLDAMRTTAQQFPHLQQRYNEVLQASRHAAGVAGAQPSSDPKPGEEFNPEAFVERMQPVIKDAVKRGAVSEEFAELYPVEAAGYAFGMWQLRQVGDILAPLVQHYQQTTYETQRNNLRAEVFDNMQKLASEDPDIYGDLTDHNQRERYLQFLADLNVEVGQLQGERARQTLAQLWPSFQGPQLIQAARAAAAKAKADQQAKRRNAGGGGGGGGQRTTPKTGLEDIEAILKG